MCLFLFSRFSAVRLYEYVQWWGETSTHSTCWAIYRETNVPGQTRQEMCETSGTGSCLCFTKCTLVTLGVKYQLSVILNYTMVRTRYFALIITSEPYLTVSSNRLLPSIIFVTNNIPHPVLWLFEKMCNSYLPNAHYNSCVKSTIISGVCNLRICVRGNCLSHIS